MYVCMDGWIIALAEDSAGVCRRERERDSPVAACWYCNHRRNVRLLWTPITSYLLLMVSVEEDHTAPY